MRSYIEKKETERVNRIWNDFYNTLSHVDDITLADRDDGSVDVIVNFDSSHVANLSSLRVAADFAGSMYELVSDAIETDIADIEKSISACNSQEERDLLLKEKTECNHHLYSIHNLEDDYVLRSPNLPLSPVSSKSTTTKKLKTKSKAKPKKSISKKSSKKENR